ncbi:MAG: enoyl-CoA hydratase [Flavobacteriaceae bacterium]
MQWSAIAVDISSDGFATITLNRPDRLNTLSIQLRQELDAAVEQLEADPNIHVLILTGKGKVFSAGMEITEWGEPGVSAQAYVHDAAASLGKFTGPVIGAINGLALTGGLELSLACDFLIASEKARFADSHVQVGLLPGWGGSVRLARRIGIGRALEMAMTARFVEADEALAWGLVNHVVPAEELLPLAEKLARQMLANRLDGVRLYKRILLEEQNLAFPEALAFERTTSKNLSASVTLEDLLGRLESLKGRGSARK